jgi:hypothetical protein
MVVFGWEVAAAAGWGREWGGWWGPGLVWKRGGVFTAELCVCLLLQDLL